MILRIPEYFTITHNNCHSYPIYTRGGPYWQYVKIPFSKFVNTSHGRVSDRQHRFSPIDVRNIGITCMDNNDGPFSLELDYIGVVRDDNFFEECAYETYRVPKYVSNT